MYSSYHAELAAQAHRPYLLVIMRHAESERNRVKKNNIFLPNDESANLVKGVADHDISLTDHGHWQARTTAEPLLNEFGPFDVVYGSGYKRVEQTIDNVLKPYDLLSTARLKRRVKDLIHERLPGYTYDMTTEDVDKYYPWFRAHWEQFGPFYTRPPGGESQEQVCARVFQFNAHLFQVRAGQKVLVVTHGGTIRAFRYCLEKWDQRKYVQEYSLIPPKNCGNTVYRFSPQTNRLELVEYNKIYYPEEAAVA